MFILSSKEDQYTHFETLFCEHKSYILIILQQIIQLQRLKKASTVLKRVVKKMIEWLDISLPSDLINSNTDHQGPTTNDTRKAKNELINQGVKTANVKYYNTDQESILSNVVTESDIYNNYSYTSCVN